MRLWFALLGAGLLMVPIGARAMGSLERGTELMVQQRYAEAEPILRHAVEKQPRNPEAHYNLGAALRELGRHDEAIAEYRRALALYGDRAPEWDITRCLYGIALAEEATGDPQAAVAAWDDYLRFARPYEAERPAVEIARMHLDGQMRAANLRRPYPFGPPSATRNQNRQ